MKPAKTTSVEELQVVSRFESLRRLLLADTYSQHLEKPLAYWALPTDRRLPLALLGRTLGDLLNTPFVDLAATPGIGQKKIRSFVKLLSRVANTDPSELPVELAAAPEKDKTGAPAGPASNGFDPASVSEVVWSQWRASVIRHGLGKEVLGRFAPSLQNMTRVIWSTPLEAYTGLSLQEIRYMKTHGEKRVQAILEVFYSVHTLVSNMGRMDHLVVRICPRLIDKVDTWTGRMLQTPGIPSNQDLYDNFVAPLVDQIRIDATQQIATLAENRLGIHGPITSVRQAARSMGLTRARVYQLLNEINDIMSVRWPMGRHLVYELRDKFQSEAAELERAPDLTQFLAAVELFYPGSRRGADGPLEFVGDATSLARDEDQEPSCEAEPMVSV
ncbi:MAG: hypothetical protein HUU20_00620 [Pirellulales bacterium]|nr:hypothetical protein [Pirellulales bacterium]